MAFTEDPGCCFYESFMKLPATSALRAHISSSSTLHRPLKEGTVASYFRARDDVVEKYGKEDSILGAAPYIKRSMTPVKKVTVGYGEWQ